LRARRFAIDITDFDDIARLFSVLPSRRDVLRGLAGAGFGLATLRQLGAVGAKNRKNRKKKPKLKRNAFGCVDVGGKCQGNDANCCSGICEGKKPKKGKKDTSRCAGHDAGICTPGSNTCALAGIAECDPSNSGCHCVGTTGNATFCGDTSGVTDGSLCRVCSKDTDCQAEFGPGAACIFLEGLCSIYCIDTGRTACVPPCA
jgi:hypothetical protein